MAKHLSVRALGTYAFGAALLISGATVEGCSSQNRVCDPGATQLCSCSSGLGAQACSKDGASWDACDCGTTHVPDGGASEGGTPTGYCDRPISTTPVMLPVVPQAQACSEWCWATTASMVLNYYGRTTQSDSQCGVVSLNLNGPCCTSGACFSACNTAGTPAPMLQARGLFFRQLPRALAPAELEYEISNGRPVIVYFNGQATGGQFAHFIVVSGFNPVGPTFHIIDPLNLYQQGASYVTPYVADLPYAALYNGPDTASPWVVSIASLSPRADGCSPVVNPTCSCQK